MGKTIRHSDCTFNELMRGAMTTTTVAPEFQVKVLDVLVLEFEDVLFHFDSAIMMPERPTGRSAEDGAAEDATDPADATLREDQDKVSGVKALGLAFKQFEFDGRRRLLLAGHADTAGLPKPNFELSDQRARNVLYLLEGDGDKWADVCEKRHQIEDYQQIMTYLKNQRSWNCDPKGMPNAWNADTDRAVEGFITEYNAWIKNPLRKDSPPIPDGPGGPLERIRNHPKHKWPTEMWRAVYDLYEDDLATALQVDRDGLKSRYRSLLQFANADKKYLACGESYPIDDAEKRNYRSQTNRRVELYFFDEKDVPLLDCPPAGTVAHKAPDCPVWHKLHFKREHIDGADLMSVVYHLRFVYFDRIHQAWKDVPEGLLIKAWEINTSSGAAAREITPTRFKYMNGVYSVKVADVAAPTRSDIFFTFEPRDTPGVPAATIVPTKPRYYVFSENTPAKPPSVIRLMDEDAVKATALADRLQYYDLPAKWSSRNYFTRTDYAENPATGGRFRKTIRDTIQLKPFGSNVTSPSRPLVFSLDDIVLAAGNRSQVIRDRNAAGIAFPNATPLDDNSRFTLFYVDHADTTLTIGGVASTVKQLMKVHNPEATQPVFTNVKFKDNLITDVPGNTRAVYFCNTFYDVWDKRTQESDSGFLYASGHVLGARMALANDDDVHASRLVDVANVPDDITRGYGVRLCGHYELHYLHNCALLGGKPLSYLIIYWSCRFVNQATEIEGLTKAVPLGRQIDIDNHRQFGMSNAMERLDNKDRLIEISHPPLDLLVRPCHFMEAKSDSNGGVHKALVNVVGNTPTVAAPDPPRAFMGPRSGQLRQRDAHPDGTYFESGTPPPLPPPLPPPPAPPPPPPAVLQIDTENTRQDTDGRTYFVLTNQHEMGHATGNPDEYLYDCDDMHHRWRDLPKYEQLFTAQADPSVGTRYPA